MLGYVNYADVMLLSLPLPLLLFAIFVHEILLFAADSRGDLLDLCESVITRIMQKRDPQGRGGGARGKKATTNWQ